MIVQKSKIGLGIFADRAFKKGEKLFHIRGVVLNYVKVNKRGGTFQDNTFRFGPETYLSPEGELGDFLNHSCEPNARVDKIKNRLYVFACRSVRKGEEITIDYSTTLAADDIWTMSCKCGSRSCRKRVKNYTSLSVELRDSYIRSGIIPRYILKI